MTDAPRKPFWKRKRWIAAAVLWLVIVYPLSIGPVAYAVGRNWLSPMIDSRIGPLYAPIIYVQLTSDTLPARFLVAYTKWFHELGMQHASD